MSIRGGGGLEGGGSVSPYSLGIIGLWKQFRSLPYTLGYKGKTLGDEDKCQ